MQFKGGRLQGARYGGVSPLDFNGLKFWLKAGDGVELLRGNLVKRWKDKSGNNNHLVPATGNTYGLRFGNSAAGRYVTGVSGGVSEPLVCINDIAHKFLTDGSPYSFIALINLGAASNIATFTGSPASAYPLYSMSFPSSSGTRSITRIIQNTSSQYGVNPNALNTYADNQSLLIADVGYGYLVAGSDFSTWVNGVTAATISWAFPPNTADPANKFALGGDTSVRIYELIIYNQTGKDRAQINDELSKLTTEYINRNYPGFY